MKQGQKIGIIEYEQSAPAREIMNSISSAGNHILVGYTDENKHKMGIVS